MTPIGDTTFDARASAANAAWRARALQKPSASANLHGERQDDPGAQTQQRQNNPDFSSPQNGTQAGVPFRYAPRLTAAFTAQLLGQIMPDPERRSSGFKSAQAYGSAVTPLALGFDTSI